MTQQRCEQFQPGDLVRLKKFADDPLRNHVAIVLNVGATMLFDRMKIQFFKTSRPEMADPLHWELVSRA